MGIRLSYLAWFLLGCTAVVGFVATSWHHGPRLIQVPTASHPIAAFTILGSNDLHLTWIPDNRIPAQALRSLPDGHRVTLVDLAPDAPIPASALGPDAGQQTGHLVVTGVQITAAAALNGSLSAGDRVTIAATNTSAQAQNVLVVQIAKTSNTDHPYAVTLGFARAISPPLLKACGSGAIALQRN